MEITKCKICGKEFITTPRHQTICSAECRIENNRVNVRNYARKKREERRMELGTRFCTVCGKEFSPKNGNQIRCSRRCTQNRSGEYKAEYRKVTKQQMQAEQKLRAKKEKEIVAMSVQAGKAHTTYGKLEMQNYLAKQSLEMARRRRELDAEWERKRKNGNQ
jgi:endogenous inhibitor of DNA gyrase (YacG/DUF329 family)